VGVVCGGVVGGGEAEDERVKKEIRRLGIGRASALYE
jgi:hypothetical protein